MEEVTPPPNLNMFLKIVEGILPLMLKVWLEHHMLQVDECTSLKAVKLMKFYCLVAYHFHMSLLQI